MSVVFIGDSHLARVRRSLTLIDTAVQNLAVGGSTVVDLASQLVGLEEDAHDASVILSIGTNDAAPWRGISVDRFASGLADTLSKLDVAAVTYLAPPGLVETRIPAGPSWTNAVIDEYRSAALDICRLHGVLAIRADHLLQPFGPEAFSKDGVHLSGTGYRALLPSINAATARCSVPCLITDDVDREPVRWGSPSSVFTLQVQRHTLTTSTCSE